MALVESSAAAPEWFRLVFFGGLGLCWCAFCAVQSFLGGWYWLARAFPRRRQAGRKFFLSPMSIGAGFLPLHYWGLCVRVGPDGLDLSVFPACRALHHPLMIPWQAMECTIEEFLGERCTAVHISNPRNRLVFTGNEGAYIYDYWSGRMAVGLAGDEAIRPGNVYWPLPRGVPLLRRFRGRPRRLRAVRLRGDVSGGSV